MVGLGTLDLRMLPYQFVGECREMIGRNAKLGWRPKEVQSAFGIKHTTFYEWVKGGLLDARKIGGVTVVTDESVQRLLANAPKASA